MHKTGVLLINLGTPDSTKTGDVRKYLRQFLMDGRVIDINAFGRFLLVNGIIAPFRAPKSAKEYRKLWTEKGSPLLYNSMEATDLLQERLGDGYTVKLAMRYQSPSIESVMNEYFKGKGFERIIVIPMFPQYASSSSGSAHQEVMRVLSKWLIIPKAVFVDAYPENEKIIRAIAENAEKKLSEQDYEHFVFSYHGLPERHLKKENPKRCLTDGCCDNLEPDNRLCYRAQCFATSRKLAKEMDLDESKYTVCFQSRLGNDPWIKPYTDDVIKKLAADGKKSILAFSPSFVADCLETTVEVGEEYKEIFEEEGGERWALVESLNTHPLWIDALEELVRAHEARKVEVQSEAAEG